MKNQSWLTVPENTDFPIQNIPFGIGSTKDFPHFAATRIGDHVINLYELACCGFLPGFDQHLFNKSALNDLIRMGREYTSNLRSEIIRIFSDGSDSPVKDSESRIILNLQDVKMLVPVQIGDYTDFYSSIEHATNVGIMFRDPANALLPNWKHLPVGYHGRSSSIGVSGDSFHRPKGQTKNDQDEFPSYGPSKQLDFELEMGFIIGKDTKPGDCISTDEADQFIFGMVLFNDWSARDIQKWEYVPLGPFLGKNFFSAVSPWIVTMEALEDFRVAGPLQDPKVLPYLESKGKNNYDINLEVYIKPENSQESMVCRSNYRFMYWNMQQQLAHHTVNGCNVRVGDLMASGTISGKDQNSYGSMLELAWKGTKPVKLSDGSERKFIQDNDTVIMRGYAEKDGIRIGFGEVSNKVLPAK